jgi:hypothetical protein
MSENLNENTSTLYGSRTGVAEQPSAEEIEQASGADDVEQERDGAAQTTGPAYPAGTGETEEARETGEITDDPEVTGYFPAIQDPPTMQRDSGFGDPDESDESDESDEAYGADDSDEGDEAEAGLVEPDGTDTGFAGSNGTVPGLVEPDGTDAGFVEPAETDERLLRMQEIQLSFIDDPRKAALDSQDLLAEVLRSLAEELAGQRGALENPTPDGAPDTERMRLAVRSSRQLIDALTHAG